MTWFFQISAKYKSHLKILGTTTVARSQFHSLCPQYYYYYYYYYYYSTM